jgi:hypothetical protein
MYEVDIDDLGSSIPYYRCGIGAKDGFGNVEWDANPEAKRLVSGDLVPVYTIQSFGNTVGIHYWDVIKLDCEGSEYDILWNLTGPPATQITVEFHQHTPARRSEEFIAELIKKMEQWYTVQHHKLYGHGFDYQNYWDTLFVLK